MDLQLSNQAAFETIAPYYDQLMHSVPYRFWILYLESLFRRHNHRALNILDLACGTGNVSLPLSRAGYILTGVDISGPMLKVGRDKAQEQQISVEFIEQDAAKLDLDSRKFDTVISLFDSLNNITDPLALQSAFHRVYAHLLDGGLFIFDVNTEVAFQHKMFDQKSTSVDGPLQYLWTSQYDEAQKLCTVNMDFVYTNPPSDPLVFREVHTQRAYDRQDLTEMLRNAGFDKVKSYDAYTVRPAKTRSDRIFIVATKALPEPEQIASIRGSKSRKSFKPLL